MLIIGHRGARGLAPENTLAAMQKGLEHGVDEIEIDLRVTKDGVVILHHDPELTDPNGQQHTISEGAYKDLLAHKSDLLTFQEALDATKNTVPLYVEVKPDEPIAPIVTIINANLHQGWQEAQLRLASFSQKTLIELHAALPEIEKIVLERWSGVQATRRARQLGTKRIVMDQRWMWFGFIKSVAHSGYQLGIYTLNDPKKAARWQKYGLAAVVTDYPDLFEK